MNIKIEVSVHDGDGCYTNDYNCCQWLDHKMGNWWCKLFHRPVKSYEKCQACKESEICE